MALTLCKRVHGCVHPPNHLGVCETNRPVNVDRAVGFLEQQEAQAKLMARVAEELTVVVGANTVLFEGGLNRDGLDVLVHAKCGWSAYRKEIPLNTVKLVLDALERVKEYLREPSQVPARQAEEEGPRRKRR